MQAQQSSPAKDLLRLVAIGSVDDGKSTLIGRLLYESGAVYQDQLQAISGKSIDFAALTDGLAAEREQGITIDVAYRFWDTPRRRFIIADTPGHLQYTRNMVTGASRADAAIILLDAKLGVLEQSRRHAYIATLLGVPQLIVAINKMDALSYRQEVFEAIRADFSKDLAQLGSPTPRFIPISALRGDNVAQKSAQMPWYQGPSLVEQLHTLEAATQTQPSAAAVFPVQSVIRAENQKRGYAGTLRGKAVAQGDEVLALPSGIKTRIAELRNPSDSAQVATPGMATQLVLEDELDLSRGELLVSADNAAPFLREVRCELVWMHEQALQPAQSYLLKSATKETSASITRIYHRMDMDKLEPVASESLELNEIAQVCLSLREPAFFTTYALERSLGSFVLIDRLSFATVAAGIVYGPDESYKGGALDAHQRAARFHQRAAHVLLAFEHSKLEQLAAKLEARLCALGHLAYRLAPATAQSLHRDPVLRALLDSGHLVLDSVLSPTPMGWPRIELEPPMGGEIEAQVDALIHDLGAGGFLQTASSEQ